MEPSAIATKHESALQILSSRELHPKNWIRNFKHLILGKALLVSPCITALPPPTYLPRRLQVGFTLRCFLRLSLRYIATQRCSCQRDLLQPQDAMSRHLGAKPPRRCGLLEDKPGMKSVSSE